MIMGDDWAAYADEVKRIEGLGTAGAAKPGAAFSGAQLFEENAPVSSDYSWEKLLSEVQRIESSRYVAPRRPQEESRIPGASAASELRRRASAGGAEAQKIGRQIAQTISPEERAQRIQDELDRIKTRFAQQAVEPFTTTQKPDKVVSEDVKDEPVAPKAPEKPDFEAGGAANSAEEGEGARSMRERLSRIVPEADIKPAPAKEQGSGLPYPMPRRTMYELLDTKPRKQEAAAPGSGPPSYFSFQASRNLETRAPAPAAEFPRPQAEAPQKPVSPGIDDLKRQLAERVARRRAESAGKVKDASNGPEGG